MKKDFHHLAILRTYLILQFTSYKNIFESCDFQNLLSFLHKAHKIRAVKRTAKTGIFELELKG